MRVLLLSFFLFAGPLTGTARETVHLAAAADLVFCLDALNAEFARHDPDVEVTVYTGSSGNFFAQIRRGAPFDLFLSADLHYPRELIAAGLAEPASLTRYAIGRIVVWTTRDDLDLTAGLAVVRDPRVRRFAIANPAHAPYGVAAQQALVDANLWSAVQPKLVTGENIAQAAQFIQTRNVDAGVVALALVLAPRLAGVGRYIEIPASAHAPLEQGAVLTNRGADNAAARRYLEFLRSPAARAVFEEYGFRLP